MLKVDMEREIYDIIYRIQLFLLQKIPSFDVFFCCQMQYQKWLIKPLRIKLNVFSTVSIAKNIAWRVPETFLIIEGLTLKKKTIQKIVLIYVWIMIALKGQTQKLWI